MKVCFSLLSLLFLAAALRAADAGSIKGTVTYDGEPPKLKPHEVKDPLNQQACKCKEVANEDLVVDEKTKGIKWVIARLMIEPKDAPPKAEKKAQITQKGCTFAPHTIIVAPGEDVEVLNPDGIAHNVHTTGYDFLNPPLNVMCGAADTSKDIKGPKYLKDAEIVKLECNIHPWMKGFIVVHDPRYAALTGDDGKFEIKNVPPGKYKMNLYLDGVPEKNIDVEVKAGAATEVNEKMKKK